MSPSQIDTIIDNHDDQPPNGGADLYDYPQKCRTSRPSDHSWADSAPEWPPKFGGFGGNLRGKGGFYNHHNSSGLGDENAFTPDLEKDDPYLAPTQERKRFAKVEQRTILAKNLSDRATHKVSSLGVGGSTRHSDLRCFKDIVDFVRGGLVLDIFLRSHERSVSISFVEGSAAQEFMSYVKRNDIYVHGKRLEFSWSKVQYTLPGHVANKIGIGALIQVPSSCLSMRKCCVTNFSSHLLYAYCPFR